MKTYVISVLVGIALSGCAVGQPMTSEEAKVIGDRTMRAYCEDAAQNDCKNMIFTGASHTKSGWLVEYKSDGYLHAVLVNSKGTTELSRFSESSE